MKIITCGCGQGPHQCSVNPDGVATVTITFTYPITLSQYPDGVTTLAHAVEFDHGEMGDDPEEFLSFAGPGDITVSVVVNE